MTVPPVLQLIHASDAPHHAAELKTIMMRMKSENRISDLIVQDITLEPFSLSLKKGNPGGIVVLLTHEMEPTRKEIDHLIGVNPDMRQFKLVEIIVDNVPYNNHFISFPQDLKPIRSRDDMNLVWKGIEQDLKVIFPKVMESEVIEPEKQPVDFKKYLKLLGVSLLALVLCNAVIELFAPNISDENRLILNLFSFLLPGMIFLLNKKELEQVTSATRDQTPVSGAVNWKQLFIKSGIALVLLLSSTFAFAIILISIGFIPGLLPPLFAMLATLVLIYYKRNATTRFANVAAPDNPPQSPVKRFLRFFGALLLYFFLSAIFWVIVFENFLQDMPDKDTYATILTVITTFLWMFFRDKRKRTKTPA